MKENILKSISNKKSILFSIMLVATIVIIELLTLRISSIYIKEEYIAKIISQVIPILIILAIAKSILPKGSRVFKKGGFFYGIILSWLFILYGINNFNIN